MKKYSKSEHERKDCTIAFQRVYVEKGASIDDTDGSSEDRR